MIFHLDGGYETVQYRQKSHLRLYYNSTSEHFPPHWHNDIEIINVLKGKLVVRCLANSYTIHEGEILIICPTSIHEIFDEPSGERFYIQANMSGFQFLSEMDTAYSIMNPAVLITKEQFPDIYDRVAADIDSIRQIYHPENDSNENSDSAAQDLQSVERTALPFMAETQIYALLLDILSVVAVECRGQNGDADSDIHPASSRNQRAMQDACKYISIHFSEPISLESVAEHEGFSKYHFERIFKQFTGMTFYQYVTKLRLSYAQQLLGDRGLAITEIALRSGFSGGSTFTRAFRQATGLTPSEFRDINEQITPLIYDPKFRDRIKELNQS
ncbi:MAG: AraC family transcriptional regulator [Lachnospiraceae bacterium]|nr:AraC family transcriptional regulator [Lachnospiraceae bacterium]